MNSIDPVALQALRPWTPAQPHASPRTPVMGGRVADAASFAGSFAGSGAGEFAQAQGKLERLDLLLTELERLTRLQAGEAHTDTRQREIDELIASIDNAAAEVALRRGFEHVALTNISPEVVNANITEANLPPGESLDLDINVRQSAQRAGFYLSMGQATIDLGGTDFSFHFRFAGPDGASAMAFASGQSLNNIAYAINTKSDETGVLAEVSGTGIVLRSADYGSDDFVSVQLIDNGDINGEPEIGIYNLASDDANAADPTGFVAFDSRKAAEGVTDQGQDVVALVDGEPVFGDGASLSFATPRLTGTLELAVGALTGRDGANAQNLGALTALTVSVLKTADDQGEQATAPELPDQPAIDALRERIRGRLSFLDQVKSDQLPPAAVAWAGQLQTGVDDPTTLAAHIRAELLGDATLSTHPDPQRILSLLG